MQGVHAKRNQRIEFCIYVMCQEALIDESPTIGSLRNPYIWTDRTNSAGAKMCTYLFQILSKIFQVHIDFGCQ